MAIGKGVIGESAQTYKLKEQSKDRISAGLKKFREAMALDAKAAASRGSALPKDWRSRVLR
jgi:hypothetical protein